MSATPDDIAHLKSSSRRIGEACRAIGIHQDDRTSRVNSLLDAFYPNVERFVIYVWPALLVRELAAVYIDVAQCIREARPHSGMTVLAAVHDMVVKFSQSALFLDDPHCSTIRSVREKEDIGALLKLSARFKSALFAGSHRSDRAQLEALYIDSLCFFASKKGGLLYVPLVQEGLVEGVISDFEHFCDELQEHSGLENKRACLDQYREKGKLETARSMANYLLFTAERSRAPLWSAIQHFNWVCRILFNSSTEHADAARELLNFYAWIDTCDYGMWNLSYQDEVAKLVDAHRNKVKHAAPENVLQAAIAIVHDQQLKRKFKDGHLHFDPVKIAASKQKFRTAEIELLNACQARADAAHVAAFERWLERGVGIADDWMPRERNAVAGYLVALRLNLERLIPTACGQALDFTMKPASPLAQSIAVANRRFGHNPLKTTPAQEQKRYVESGGHWGSSGEEGIARALGRVRLSHRQAQHYRQLFAGSSAF